MSASPLVLVVVVPLAAAAVAFSVRGHRLVVAAGLMGAGASAVVALWLVVVVRANGPQQVALAGWAPPLGIELRADGLAAVLIGTTAVVGLLASAFAGSWFPRPVDGQWSQAAAFWPLWLVLWGGMQATFLAADLFNAYVALELVTLAAVGLVALPGHPRNLRAALRYLLAGLAASAAYLVGVALLYGAHGTLAMPLLAERMGPDLVDLIAVVALTGGLALKTALFPLHFWLPAAHGSAPSPVSAVLSGLVVKAGLVVLVRVWLEVSPGAVAPLAAQSVGVLGVAALVWGAWRALREQRLKMVVAQSTVSQLGLLVVVVPAALPLGSAPATAAAIPAAGAMILAHALAKAALFLGAGALHRGIGSDELDRLAGSAWTVPAVALAYGLAGASLVGLPYTAGYVAKSLLLEISDGNGQWWWSLVIDLSGVVTAAYLLRIGWILARRTVPRAGRDAADREGGVTSSRDDGARRAPVPSGLLVAPVVLAGLVIAIGVWPASLEEVLTVGEASAAAPSGSQESYP